MSKTTSQSDPKPSKKMNNTVKTPQVIRPQFESSGGLRRSKRNRLPPLNYWCGERPQYLRDQNENHETIVGVHKGSQDLIHFCKSPKKRKKTKVTNSVVKNKRSFLDLSLHHKRMQKVFKQNDENRSTQQNAECIHFVDDYNWVKSERCVGVETAIINTNVYSGRTFGMLKLGPMAVHKNTKKNYVTHFTVTHGALGLQIQNNPKVIVKTGYYFRIEKRVNYKIQNSREDTAYLSFTILKD